MSRSLAWVLVFGMVVAALWLSGLGRGVRDSYRPSNKASLGSVRSALQVYYGDHGGRFPGDLSALVPKYLESIPLLWDGSRGVKYPHPPTREVVNYAAGSGPGDTGKWAYFNDPSDQARWGGVVVDCAHEGARGARNRALSAPWSSF